MFKFLFQSLYYAFFLAIVALVTLLVASFFPFDNWYQVKVVLSGSMEPSIQTGSIVVIRPAESYVVGDVITFGRDTRTQIPVTHRIVTEENGAFITKGDANEGNDPGLVTPREIIGKVNFAIPYIGYVLEFTKTPTGFFMLVIVPGVIIFISETIRIVRELWQMRKRKQSTSIESM